MGNDETTPRGADEVRAAIALLDRHGPEGWRDRVDLDRLNTMSWSDCVLGQVYDQEPDYQASPDGRSNLGAWLWAKEKLWMLDPNGYDAVRTAFADFDGEWRRQLSGGS